jgi:IS5 family transposase
MQLGFFDVNKRLERLDKLNDPLKVLLSLIDFEIFREEIEKGLEKERKDNSGRKPFDKVMLFKAIIIKRLYDLSNDELEFQKM